MLMFLLRTVIAALIIGVVSEIAHRTPRLGAVLLTLPVVSIIAILMTWFKDHDLKNLSQLSRETLILVPLGLPFFAPLAFADRLGLNFWSALGAGLVLASLTIGTWLMLGPSAQGGYDTALHSLFQAATAAFVIAKAIRVRNHNFCPAIRTSAA